MEYISPSADFSNSDFEKNKSHKIKGERFTIYCDCPITDVKISRYKSAAFKTIGDLDAQYVLRIVSDVRLKHADFILTTEALVGASQILPTKISDISIEYIVLGDTALKIKWK